MALRIEEFRAFVMTRFVQEFSYDIPIEWPNSPFQQPKNEIFGRFFIVGGDAHAASIGRGVDRHIGLIQFDVLTPKDGDIRDAGEIAEAAADVYHRQTFQVSDGHVLRFKVARVDHMGEANGFYRTVMRITFQRDVRQ